MKRNETLVRALERRFCCDPPQHYAVPERVLPVTGEDASPQHDQHRSIDRVHTDVLVVANHQLSPVVSGEPAIDSGMGPVIRSTTAVSMRCLRWKASSRPLLTPVPQIPKSLRVVLRSFPA